MNLIKHIKIIGFDFMRKVLKIFKKPLAYFGVTPVENDCQDIKSPVPNPPSLTPNPQVPKNRYPSLSSY